MDINDIKHKVDDIIESELDVRRECIVDNAKLVDDLAADSIDTINVILAIEEEFNIIIDDNEAENVEVKDIYDLILKIKKMINQHLNIWKN